ncbi:MAG: hypothetical protein ACI4NG_03225, partial [Candidatus Gallimonas sp.]
MKRNEIEQELRRESETYVPDGYDRICAALKEEGLLTSPADEIPTKRAAAPRARRKRRLFGGIAASLATIAACFAIVLPIALRDEISVPTPEYATVCMKINPAVELTVTEGAVTQTRALNKDGAVLLLCNDFTGKSAEEACSAIALLAEKSNKMTEAGITLYVSGKDETALETSIRARLASENYTLAETDSAYAERLATEYKISLGKAKVAAEVLTQFPAYSEKEIVKYDVEDLYEILEDYRKEDMDEIEARLNENYQDEYKAFVGKVQTLLNEYESALDELNASFDTVDDEEWERKVADFNERFSVLGDDFLPKEEKKKWEKSYRECKEELADIQNDLS